MAAGLPKPIHTVLDRIRQVRFGGASRSVGLAAVIGMLAGVVAYAFDALTDFFKLHLAEGPMQLEGEFIDLSGPRPWLIVIVPALGGAAVGWMTARFAPEAEGHGTEALIKSFHRLAGRVRRRVIAVKALCSALTIGTGGSAGQEGPVAQVGSGIGSMVADAFGLPDRDRRVMLLAGASAGIGALFTAPLGGALFAPEVVYRRPEFEGDAIIPCIISSIVGYTTFTSLSGRSRAIELDPALLENLSFGGPAELPLYLVLALVCTAVGWLWVRSFDQIGALFRRMKRTPLALRAGLGGLMLGVVALAIAPFSDKFGVLFGGYDLMRGSITGEITLVAAVLLIFGKILATSFTIASGGSGGVFAPSLAIGALCGTAVGQVGNALFPSLGIEPAAVALVGMGGFFAGVAKTPIAAILMVSEMTGHYSLLAPLMLVSVLHLLLARNWSIYETQVDGLVDSPAHAGDFVVDVLEEMRVEEVIDKSREPVLIHQNATLRAALDLVSSASGSYFPVIDGDGAMVGIFSLSDIRRIFLETDVHNLVLVRDFMVDKVVTTTPNESLNDALRKLNERSVHEIPVVSADDPTRVIAMLTRNNVGAAYHRRLRELRRAAS
ncbi:chloride channel protein [Engelhardtia mirabilis]|uniref:H(+)/Cl(-) exchange transporter ClcA n=1 Tax=Engelhardtia mirabilis TaxID=2528011 RepID=A0A518BF63_9BACT|nr:H(+)/Cl(-) exchange transporter ClcA [Planctomycetes bacterium Pla133]QDU99955.1 H(+)/Cl(-) exchange transporter ClcA [Planctomycetes bacterium Pla86]